MEKGPLPDRKQARKFQEIPAGAAGASAGISFRGTSSYLVIFTIFTSLTVTFVPTGKVPIAMEAARRG